MDRYINVKPNKIILKANIKYYDSDKTKVYFLLVNIIVPMYYI